MTIPIDFVKPIWSIKVPPFPQQVAPLNNTTCCENITEEWIAPFNSLYINVLPRDICQQVSA